MGSGHASNSGTMHGEAKLAAQKFDQDEIHVLRKTWQDLADRSSGKGVDKDTFLQYFPLNGLLGERLFAQFDTKKTGSIDFDEFILGLATVCRGSIDDKIHFVFNMYDVSHDNTVSKQDLTTLLNQIPKGALGSYDYGFDGGHHYGPHSPLPNDMIQRQRSNSGSSVSVAESANGTDDSLVASSTASAAAGGHHSRDPSGTTKNPVSGIAESASAGAGAATAALGTAPGILERSESGGSTKEMSGQHRRVLTREGSSSIAPLLDSDYEDVDFYTNHDMVERAFQECDLNHEGRLSYEEFKMWVQRTPRVMEYIESILPYNGPKDMHAHHHKKDTLPHLKRIASRMSMGRGSNVMEAAGEVFNHSTANLPAGQQGLKQRSLSMRMSGGGGNPRHSMSMQHLTLNMANVGGSGPHSPMVGAGTPMSHQQHSHVGTPASVAGGPTAATSCAGAGAKEGGAISRASSFGFPTPMHANSTHGQAGDRFSVDLTGGSTHGGTAMPGEYSLATGPRSVASPGGGFVDGQHYEYDSEELARLYLIHAMEATQNEALRSAINTLLEDTPGGGVITFDRNDSTEVYRAVVSMEAYLWKKGKSMFHMLSKRYYLLSGNCMYYYTHKSDVRPKGVIFLTGFIIEKLKDDEMAHKGYYGFEIMHQDMTTGEHHRHEKRVLYCKSEDERDRWVSSLQHAAHVVPIEDDYVIGKELGRGRFSVVCECVHKVTGVHCAVKIIDKATIEPEEKGLLRTEIAVLKLVNHPNIIHMEGLYESKQFIYIVMEMLKGGELFERIVGRPRFTELEAAKLIRPLLESVAYLHDLGIVHRDLKPENILCGEELEDLKIADFGLSKMVLPKEKMDSACGTLSYVAPEVLTMQGYGREADLWSVGVIMFLLLCGKLPFDGEDHNEIIRSTIQADLKVNPAVWGKLSEEARGLMTALLNKNPKDRISARDALRHPYILLYSPHIKRSHQPTFSSLNGEPLIRSGSKDSLTGLSVSSGPTASAAAAAPAAATSTTAQAAAASAGAHNGGIADV
eukprot:CAMPEP_0170369566 /NCGR_PEP_ID=MMETSP0117_2-20130122/8050_1 /TAXON_ID=400756 /ORGANISM="Durinskia baltica, Strain CSIRO CS-38" /LENGTH=1024 /DNA_ID=CAMNT_0010624291 /DNA_START=209 /DNA_END=3283 /DNA_ORIENTATION=+